MKQQEFACFARLNELANMFSLISGKTFDEAFDIIASTEYGRDIASNNPVVMYEQTNENLRAIAEELQQSDLFTIEKIIDVYLNGDFSNLPTKRTNFASAQKLKERYKELLSIAKKRHLLQCAKNKRDAWRKKHPLTSMMDL